jgi:hypothetical protein
MARLLAFFLLLPGLAVAATVEVKSVEASSVEKPEVGVNYEADNMLLRSGFKYWAEGDGSAGLGTRIDVKFPKTYKLIGFALWNGSQADEATWKNSNRIKTLEFEFKAGTFGDAVKETIELKDEIWRTVYRFKEPRNADQLKMFVRAVVEGDAYNETAVSFIEFLIEGPEEFAYATAATASSQADGFAGRSAVDGLLDTPWCVAEGKGKDETLTITLPAGTRIQGLVGHFGLNIDGEWEKNARPKSVKVQIGERSFDWSLEDNSKGQKLDLGGSVEATSVTVTLGPITKGRIYKDACISELQFLAAP